MIMLTVGGGDGGKAPCGSVQVIGGLGGASWSHCRIQPWVEGRKGESPGRLLRDGSGCGILSVADALEEKKEGGPTWN